jgi:hypothetical protein
MLGNSTTKIHIGKGLTLFPFQDGGMVLCLIDREDIKEIIQRPIWSRFGLRRPRVAIENDDEACQKAFSNVCAFIGTRDLIQEHIAYRVWPLVDSWETPKETVIGSSEGGLVRLEYTFRFRDRFDEPNDDWLKSIEAASDELLGAYTKAEDDALSSAFGGRIKKRLNRVFDAIGFIYPNYCYPSRRQGKKRKAATLAIPVAPKGKKIKVLTHRPRYIETATMPKLCEETSSVAKAEPAAPATRSAEESTVVPKVPIAEAAKAKDEVAKRPEIEKTIGLPKILSPLEKNRTTEDHKSFRRHSQKEKNGKCTRRRCRDNKSVDSYSYEESCRSCYNSHRNQN